MHLEFHTSQRLSHFLKLHCNLFIHLSPIYKNNTAEIFLKIKIFVFDM